jgi:hypothetical protein
VALFVGYVMGSNQVEDINFYPTPDEPFPQHPNFYPKIRTQLSASKRRNFIRTDLRNLAKKSQFLSKSGIIDLGVLSGVLSDRNIMKYSNFDALKMQTRMKKIWSSGVQGKLPYFGMSKGLAGESGG